MEQPRLTSRGRAPVLKGGLQLGQALHGGVGADALILGHSDALLCALVVTDRGGDRHDLGLETALSLGSGCPASTVDRWRPAPLTFLVFAQTQLRPPNSELPFSSFQGLTPSTPLDM